MLDDLKELINKSKYVSFDIFDTAVLRAVLNPTDLFGIVEKYYEAVGGSLNFDYGKIRVESEKRARGKAWTLRKCSEATLDEIYQCMIQDFNIERQVAEDLMKLEIDTEIKTCTCSEFIYAVYKFCVQNGKKVIFMSDMYLPRDVIITILRKSGYSDFDKLFLSSSLGVTKSTGDLYKLLLQELQTEPEEILHIGDNYDSDINIAKKFGLRTFFYEKCFDIAFRHKDLKENLLDEFLQGDNTTEESVLAATFVNHYCSNRVERGDISDNFWYDFGYKYIGILFFGFGSWLIDQARKDEIEKLYFLSRDGFIMKKVYDLISQFVENSPQSEYIYASRRALNIPSITNLDDEVMDFLVGGTSILRVAQFLERLGFNPAQYIDKIKEAGFSAKDSRIITGGDYYMLRKLYTLIFDAIEEKAERERKIIFEYFDDIGLFGTKRIGVVDIGWHGTLQHSITKLLRIFGKEISIKGYYLGTFSKAKELCKAGNDMSAYLCEFAEPDNFHKIIKQCVEIFEFVHTAPHGSVINFERISGKVEPIFDHDDEESIKIEKAQAVQEGALDFVNDLIKTWRHFDFLRISKETVIKPLYRVLRNPTYEETVKLGDLEHAEGFGNVYVKRCIAKPPGFVEILTNPYSFVQGYKQSFWRRGYIKRFFLKPVLGKR